MARMIKHHQGLREIRLQNNYIEWGGIDITIALRENNRLEKLDLSKNRLYIQGAEELAESMQTDTCLRSLDITDCYIGKGIRLFMQMTGSNASLQVLCEQRFPVGSY